MIWTASNENVHKTSAPQMMAAMITKKVKGYLTALWYGFKWTENHNIHRGSSYSLLVLLVTG